LVKKSAKKVKEKLGHLMVPEHVLLPEEDKRKVLAKYNAAEGNFPMIFSSDPALIGMGANPGDMVLIKRKDVPASYDYYRIVAKG